MQKDQIKDFVKQLIDAGFTTGGPMCQCSEDDIKETEKRFNVRLPAVYKNFLRLIGRNSGNFLQDGSWHYPFEFCLPGAMDLLEENESSFKMPDGAFVFIYRSNFFMYFQTGGSDDPPVYIFLDGKKEPELFFDSFTDWFKTVVEGEIANHREAAQLYKEGIDSRYQEDTNEPTVP